MSNKIVIFTIIATFCSLVYFCFCTPDEGTKNLGTTTNTSTSPFNLAGITIPEPLLVTCTDTESGLLPECARVITADSISTIATYIIDVQQDNNVLFYEECFDSTDRIFWIRYIPFSNEPMALSIQWDFLNTDSSNYLFGIYEDCNDVMVPGSCKSLRPCISGGQRKMNLDASPVIPLYFAIENLSGGAITIAIDESALNPGESCSTPDPTAFNLDAVTSILPTSQKKLPTGISGCLTTTDGREVYGWHWYKHTLSVGQSMARIISGTKIPILAVQNDRRTVIACQDEVTMDKPFVVVAEEGDTFYFVVPVFYSSNNTDQAKAISIYLQEGICDSTVNGTLWVEDFESYQTFDDPYKKDGWKYWASVSEFENIAWNHVDKTIYFPTGEGPSSNGGDFFAHLYVCGTPTYSGNVNMAFLEYREEEQMDFSACSGAQIQFDFLHWSDAAFSIEDGIRLYYKSVTKDWTLIENDVVSRYGTEGWTQNHRMDISEVAGQQEVQLRLAAWTEVGGCCDQLDCPVEYYWVSFNIDNLKVMCCY